MDDNKILNYLKIQIAKVNLTKEQVLEKYPNLTEEQLDD